jgi:hypothetical protein
LAVFVDDNWRNELGPLAVGLGGAIAAAGSIMPWGVVTFQPGPLGVVPSKLFTPVRDVIGTHTTEGKIALAIALLISLLGIAGLIIRRSRAATVIASAAAACAIGLGALAITEFGRVSDTSSEFNPLHFPLQYQGVPFRHYVDVTTSYGLSVVIAGAAVALVGSIYAVIRARSRGRIEGPRHYSVG